MASAPGAHQGPPAAVGDHADRRRRSLGAGPPSGRSGWPPSRRRRTVAAASRPGRRPAPARRPDRRARSAADGGDAAPGGPVRRRPRACRRGRSQVAACSLLPAEHVAQDGLDPAVACRPVARPRGLVVVAVRSQRSQARSKAGLASASAARASRSSAGMPCGQTRFSAGTARNGPSVLDQLEPAPVQLGRRWARRWASSGAARAISRASLRRRLRVEREDHRGRGDVGPDVGVPLVDAATSRRSSSARVGEPLLHGADVAPALRLLVVAEQQHAPASASASGARRATRSGCGGTRAKISWARVMSASRRPVSRSATACCRSSAVRVIAVSSRRAQPRVGRRSTALRPAARTAVRRPGSGRRASRARRRAAPPPSPRPSPGRGAGRR